jgi:hypothetical protein
MSANVGGMGSALRIVADPHGFFSRISVHLFDHSSSSSVLCLLGEWLVFFLVFFGAASGQKKKKRLKLPARFQAIYGE